MGHALARKEPKETQVDAYVAVGCLNTAQFQDALTADGAYAVIDRQAGEL